MSDYVVIETGARPWQPSSDAGLVAVYHRFTIPLVGTIRQGGTLHLFWCVVGHAAPENAWAYAPVDDDITRLLSESTSETFDDTLVAAVGDRANMFAIAGDDKGVTVSVTLDPPATFEAAYKRGMDGIQRKIQEAVEEYENLMQRFPLMTVPGIVPTPRSSMQNEGRLIHQ